MCWLKKKNPGSKNNTTHPFHLPVDEKKQVLKTPRNNPP